MKLNYIQCGDYLLPDLGVTEEEMRPLGKYGMMRKKYLQDHRPGLFSRLLLGGKLMEHLHEIDETAESQLETMMNQLKKQNGVTEELKAKDQMAWVAQMNSLKHQAEEVILTELIYV